MTEVEAAKLVTLLVTAFADEVRWLSEQQQETMRGLYRQFLLDLPYRAGDQAVVRLIATSRKMPKIADLRSAIQAQLHGRPATAGEAWGAVLRLRSPHFSPQLDELDPVLRRCLESMGWIVRDTVLSGGVEHSRWRVETSGNEVADRARFCELYDQLAARQESELTVGQLAPPVPVRRLAAGAPESMAVILAKLPTPKE